MHVMFRLLMIKLKPSNRSRMSKPTRMRNSHAQIRPKAESLRESGSRGTGVRVIRSLAVFAAVVLLFALKGFAQAGSPKTNDARPLRIRVEENNAPWSYDDNGVIKGRDIDFAIALGKKLGRPVRIDLSSWEAAVQAVEKGDADAVLFVDEPDPERKNLDLSDPVFRNSVGIFVRTGEIRIRGLNDLDYKKVGVMQEGSDPVLAGRSKVILVKCKDYADAFGKLASGEIDAVVTSTWLGAYWVQQQPGRNFTIAGEPFSYKPVGVGVRKGNFTLLEQINRAVRGLKNDGSIDNIEAKWRPQEILFVSRQKVHRAVFFSVGVSVGLLLVSMGIWIIVLKRQKERLRLLAHAVHSANDCIIISDPDDRILMVNAAFEKTYDYKESEIIGKSAGTLRADNNASDLAEEILSSTLEGGWRGEVWNRSKSGRVFPISLTASPLKDEDGKLVAMVGVARDITLEKRAADALRASQERFSKLFHASPDWISLAELDSGKVLEVNERFEEITGYSRDEILGRPPSDLGIFIDPTLYDRVMSILREGVPVRDFEYGLRRKSGESGAILASVELIEIAGCRYTLAVHHDITMRRKMEEQLRQSQKMDAIGQLAAGIAHDFNNLLTIISMTCEATMLKLPQDHVASPAFNDIQATTTRAANLTQQLLAFSRQQPVRPRVLNLNSAILDVHSMSTRLIKGNVELAFIQGDQIGAIRIDEGQLQQIVLNLVLNARDAMPNGGKLLLETCNVRITERNVAGHSEMPVGDYVMLAVTDSGTGMDAATRARIFEPFFTTKERGKGTGLGLATVYGIVKQNNGYIWVYSEVGLGTTFKVYFPRLNESASAVIPAAAPDPADGHETILLVEDEHVLRSKLCDYLKSIGYRVISAGDGDEAVKLCEFGSEKPVLMITDVGLPKINGAQLGKVLSTRMPKLKILYLSGYTDDAILRNGILPAGSSYLQKPFALDALAEKVRELLQIKPGV